MPTCECCGDEAGEWYRLALEWPPKEPDEDELVTFDDPGAGELRVCGGCADGVATNVLVNRAITRGLDDVYAGLKPGAHADMRRCEVADD